MCDGVLFEKMKVLREIMKIEGPKDSQEYMDDHLAWTLDELITYRNKLTPAGASV
jgi:hypothetical protein